MKLLIQIPCYNEAATLKQTIDDLPKHIEGVDTIEYLIINDGSKDETVAAAKACGVHHVVNCKRNRGLARGFMSGIDACLRLGADIIVNTDADNQYCGQDIEKLVTPILTGAADFVVGTRPIADIEHFSNKKKFLQKFGSGVVRFFSGTDVEDAPSGFRAYSRAAAMRLNVHNNYTYTMETIIQAGQSKLAIECVPIRTNPETRKSRLFKSMTAYIRRSGVTIIRSFMMYKPLRFFSLSGGVLLLLGLILDIRFLILYLLGDGDGHIQSIILSAIFLILGLLLLVFGLMSDLISANRKLLEDIQVRVRDLDYRLSPLEGKSSINNLDQWEEAITVQKTKTTASATTPVASQMSTESADQSLETEEQV